MSGSSVVVGRALLDFSLHGTFPEEDVSSLRVTPNDLGPAIAALAAARRELEAEIRTINAETAPDVERWFANAKALEEDIARSKALANDIVRQSEAPDASGKTILEAEETVAFLSREVRYNRQVLDVLGAIQHVGGLLDQVEQARQERRIIDSLHLLEQAWTAIDNIPVSKSVRAMKLLDMRAFELKSDVHDVFDHVWRALVDIDRGRGRVTIYDRRDDEVMSLQDAVVGLMAYKEVDKRMAEFWHDLDEAIVGPRTDIERSTMPSIQVSGKTLALSTQADKTIKSLFFDIKGILDYLRQSLPSDLLQPLAQKMMPELVFRIIDVWLNSAVPSSLKQMDAFQDVIESTKSFYESLRAANFYPCDELQEWVENAPKFWLARCRETALDTVRFKLSQGLGSPKQVERVETQMVTREEGKELAANGATGDEQEWDAAWDDGEAKEDDGADAWGWGDDEDQTGANEQAPSAQASNEVGDDAVDAWGWGEETGVESTEDTAEPETQKAAARKPKREEPDTREITVKETYSISSMPEPVLSLISGILEDGAALTREGNEINPVASAAAGLFSLPTLALALFRAIAPYYYELDMGGKMYLYNDALYLAEQLSKFASAWKTRDDISARARNMLRIDNEIEALRSFGNRAYSNEMSTQKTVLRDLIGGAQNIFQRDGRDFNDVEASIDSTVARVRTMAAAWNSILPRSAWCQAVGSLVDSISSKIIADVLDLESIGQDDAYNTARLIAKVTELDDLFPGSADSVPSTARYVPSWLRLKYLSELLQSNLRDVRYLWFESELSLCFTAEEVIDLIGLSFEDNARRRDVVKEIERSPNPLGQQHATAGS